MDHMDYMALENDKTNQQINDAVEAAVMRYVGGTLERRTSSASSKKRPNEDLMLEYQWDRFLEDEVNKKKEDDDIDPELATLNTSSEHDQLVQAAIMGAGELAKQLGGIDDQNLELSAINQLAQAASSLSTKRPAAKRKKLRKDVKEEPKFETTSIEQLIRDLSAQACQWYNAHGPLTGGPRPFSPEEISAVEAFVTGYCQLNKLTREDVCNRVWANERTKDSFWELLTKVLPYRSRASVYKHVKRQYHIFSVRAKWSKEDDEWLRKLASAKEGNWKEIGETMGRMPEDCRDRWRNYVKCGDNRMSNKWLDEEETKFRQIVLDMLKDNANGTINWTTVSERMNGQRLRIQCRYKWNKLLKRELLNRSKLMNIDTKFWLLHRLQQLNYDDVKNINWQEVVDQLNEYVHANPSEARRLTPSDFSWSAHDFRVVFEKLKATLKDHRSMSLASVLDCLIDRLYGQTINSNMIDSEIGEFDKDKKETAMANAAVAAVAAVSTEVSEQESQHQEYSLWR